MPDTRRAEPIAQLDAELDAVAPGCEPPPVHHAPDGHHLLHWLLRHKSHWLHRHKTKDREEREEEEDKKDKEDDDNDDDEDDDEGVADIDVLIANEDKPSQLLTNDGSGTFTATDLTDGLAANAAALGDLDGDGDLDALLANFGRPSEILINDGSGNFSARQVGRARNSEAVALGDLDGDGDLDALLGNDRQPIQLLTNDGSGSFAARKVTDKIVGPDTEKVVTVLDLALGDLDGDGDLDALAATDGDANQLLINDGTGHFTVKFIKDDDTFPDTEDVALGDLDGDGDLDALFANDGQGIQMLTNDGDANFSAKRVTGVPGLDGVSSKAVAIGDLDGDGDLDALVANTTRSEGVPEFTQLLRNDGDGNFTVTSLGKARRSEDICLGDLDGDGDLDAILAVSTFPGKHPHPSELLINDGQGNFTPVDLPSGVRISHGLALGDLDGDGTVPVVDQYGLPNINQHGLLPDMFPDGIW